MLTTQSRPQKSQFLVGPRKKSKKRTDRLAWGSSMAATTCSRGQATAYCCAWRLGSNRWKTTTRQARTAPSSARSHEARCSSIRYWHRGLSKYMHVRASRMLHCRRASRNSLTKAPRERERRAFDLERTRQMAGSTFSWPTESQSRGLATNRDEGRSKPSEGDGRKLDS